MYLALVQDQSLWRALLSSKVGLVFIVTFFWASLSLASAQTEDVTPPTLTALSFTPTTINTAAGPADVTVSWSATDDLAGVTELNADFLSPSGAQSVRIFSTSAPATNVSQTGLARFPQFSETGTWKLSFLSLRDATRNDRVYSTAELAQLGFPTELEVGGEEDITPPTLTALSFTPTTINTAAGPADVTVSWSATDDLAGVTELNADFLSPSGAQSVRIFSTSAPATNVSQTGLARFPQFSETGTWKLSFLSLRDATRNDRVYSTAELAQLGFPTELEVGGEEDITPPTLTALSFTPTTINTAAGPADVTVSWSATDDLAGVTELNADFLSPSGAQSVRIFSTSAPATNVSQTGLARFPQFSETGTWKLSFLSLRDATRNDRVYSTAELAQLGFPTELEVGGEEEDVTLPVIKVSATPKTIWPPNGKMVPVTISGAIKDAESGVNASTAAYVVTDEYGLIQPSGPIHVEMDGSYTFTIQLQASRRGNDQDGREYVISISAQDNAGNEGSNSTIVTVPHDQK